MSKAAVDNVSSAYQTFNQAIDRVLKERPGPDRWKAALKLWLSLSPANKYQYEQLRRENAKVRKAVDTLGVSHDIASKMRSVKGTSDHTMRQYMTFPSSLYYLLEKADPMAFRDKRNAALMFKTFKPLTTREIY